MLIYLKQDNRPHIRLILRAVQAAFAGAPTMFRTRAKVQTPAPGLAGPDRRAP